MENMFYNILWIDDQHEALTGTKGRAKRNGINLIPFKSLNGGMDELERNYPFYDGVLLDAKFFENEDDIKGTEDTYNVHRAKERLLQLKKKFEVFVLTGQAEAYEDKTFAKAFTNVYKKGSDEEIDRLFVDIKVAAATQEDTQIRQNYKRVFDVCTEKYIGEYAGQDILNLLKINNETEVDKNLSTIRDVVQDLFSTFHKFNLLPAEFITPTVYLNESSRFLTGKSKDGSLFSEKGYKHLDGTHLPTQISNNLRNVLMICQPGSHRTEIDNHIRKVRTHYLMKSLLYQILDVIVWFKMYVDANPKTENWERIEAHKESSKVDATEMIAGVVINFNAQKGFAFFKPNSQTGNTFIPPHLVAMHALVEGSPVEAIIEEYIDLRTNELKTRVSVVKLI